MHVPKSNLPRIPGSPTDQSTPDAGQVKPTIAIVMAMQAEAAPVIERYNLQRTNPLWAAQPKVRVYEGLTDNTQSKLVLIQPGSHSENIDNVGTVPAVVSTMLALTHFSPTHLINAGTAGGFEKQGANIGDVYIATASMFHDRRIPIPGYTAYGIGSYQLSDHSKMATQLGLKQGKITTGDSLDFTARDLEIMLQHEATIKDMEAAAITWVSQQMGINPIIIKSITDIIESKQPSHEEFMENLTLASKRLQEKLTLVIDYLSQS